MKSLPEVVLIKDEDSDSNDTFDEADVGMVTSSTPIGRGAKRLWPGSDEAERKSSSEQLNHKLPKLSTGPQKKSVSVYTLDSPRGEPGCSAQLGGGGGEVEAGDCSYSSQLDPDIHLVQDCSLVSPSSNRQTYFGSGGGALMEAQSPSGRAEMDLSLTWTKQSKGQMSFAQFHQNDNMDAGDAYGLKLISVSGSTSTDCQLSESSNSAFEYEDGDMMNFTLYRDGAGRSQPGGGAFLRRSRCSRSPYWKVWGGSCTCALRRLVERLTETRSSHVPSSNVALRCNSQRFSLPAFGSCFDKVTLNMLPAAAFHAQLSSIMEVLANTAVAEICDLVDNGYSVLQLEISRSRKENEVLRRKLRLMELRAARTAALRAAVTGGGGGGGGGALLCASGRARALLLGHHRATTRGGAEHPEVVLPRQTPQDPPQHEDPRPPSDSVTEPPQPAAAEAPSLSTALIKVEVVDESWSQSEHDKQAADAEAPPPVTKQETPHEGDDSSRSWASGEVSSTSTFVQNP
ncbi:hypothetical protein INR49_019990 [Caranx melampygus]|nr:hypothetical protein INR49_019990 [Caranx melampygus]